METKQIVTKTLEEFYGVNNRGIIYDITNIIKSKEIKNPEKIKENTINEYEKLIKPKHGDIREIGLEFV